MIAQSPVVAPDNHGISENRFEIARLIACPPDELRYIGDQDVFVLHDKVIDHILAAEREKAAKAAAPIAMDPIRQTVAETIKDAIRRRSVERDAAKAGMGVTGSPGRKTPVFNVAWQLGLQKDGL